MLYACPEPDDFAETRALNKAFLAFLITGSASAKHLGALHPQLAAELRSLDSLQTERLAEVPFLLLSFREADRTLWERPPACDAVAEPAEWSPLDNERQRLVAAALGFAWQLARRNPYVLRLLSGASLNWCERLAEQPFISVVHRVSASSDLPRLRAAGDTSVWRKLLTDGVSSREGIRRAAQLSSLHMRLTRPPPDSPRWANAACKTPATALTLRREP